MEAAPSKPKRTTSATVAAAAGRWAAALAKLPQESEIPPGSAGISLRIHRARIENKKSISELARLVGVAPMTLMRWESGRCFPGVDDVERLAKELRRSPGALVRWA